MFNQVIYIYIGAMALTKHGVLSPSLSRMNELLTMMSLRHNHLVFIYIYIYIYIYIHTIYIDLHGKHDGISQ